MHPFIQWLRITCAQKPGMPWTSWPARTGPAEYDQTHCLEARLHAYWRNWQPLLDVTNRKPEQTLQAAASVAVICYYKMITSTLFSVPASGDCFTHFRTSCSSAFVMPSNWLMVSSGSAPMTSSSLAHWRYACILINHHVRKPGTPASGTCMVARVVHGMLSDMT